MTFLVSARNCHTLSCDGQRVQPLVFINNYLPSSSEEIQKIFVRRKMGNCVQKWGILGLEEAFEKHCNRDSPNIFITSWMITLTERKGNSLFKEEWTFWFEWLNSVVLQNMRVILLTSLLTPLELSWVRTVFSPVFSDNLVVCWLFGHSRQAGVAAFCFIFLLDAAQQ